MPATKAAASTASASWLTEAAARACSIARRGSPGLAIPHASMKICAPICSAMAGPLRRIEPLSGAGMPEASRRNAVCSVERARPPNQSTVLFSTM